MCCGYHPFCLGVFCQKVNCHTSTRSEENISLWPHRILTSEWYGLNKLLSTNYCSPLTFLSVFPDIFTPFSNQWYIEIYEPIIILIKLSCPCYIYFLPNLLLFHYSLLSLSLTLNISLDVPWLTPVNIYPLKAKRKDQIYTKYNARCGFCT